MQPSSQVNLRQIEMNSVASSMMFGVTAYHNSGQADILTTEMGYAATAVVALVESAAALVFTALALPLYPISSYRFDCCVKWLSSSAFTCGWAITNFFISPFVDKLVADEKSAREIVRSGNLMTLPQGAII